MPYEGNEEYFGGSMQYGDGSAGRGRDYDKSRRGYDDERSDAVRPDFGRSGNRGSEYAGGRYRRRGGYSEGFGSEASRRHSGVGYSGRSGYRGEDRPSRYDRRFGGPDGDGFADREQNRFDSMRSNGRNYGGRERGWWERTSDEVAAWLGDEQAARRRENDSRREGYYRGRGPSDYTRSDERINEDINDRLTDHPYIDASNINVETNDGDVTLSGSVESRYEKRLAEDVAEEVSGVRNVENRIRINNTYSATPWNHSYDTGRPSADDAGASSDG
jgi:osmotically-inducible protein OsmY